MSRRKNSFVMLGLVLAFSMIAAAFSVVIVSGYDSRIRFDMLNAVCAEMIQREPEAKEMIFEVLKAYSDGNVDGIIKENEVLQLWGYHSSDFSSLDDRYPILVAGIVFFVGSLLFVLVDLQRNKMRAQRIMDLTEYLEQVNTGKAVIFSALGEDDFSKLEDEIYKTVTYLYQTKDAAVQAKNDYAENLSNIAHQMKTPITAMSLSVQMMKQNFDNKYLKQVEKQLLQLMHLEDALLLLSRMDAGTLLLQKDEVDVFTILVLAADNLRELLDSTGICVDIPEQGEMKIIADLDWTMEAVMNLMKNCMEHSHGGMISCSYTQNPLYTEIIICDDGEGFAQEDLPHLFERFYRGQNVDEGGIGIGLALSKEIIERQNGIIQAKNRPGGGAAFEIRFYSH